MVGRRVVLASAASNTRRAPDASAVTRRRITRVVSLRSERLVEHRGTARGGSALGPVTGVFATSRARGARGEPVRPSSPKAGGQNLLRHQRPARRSCCVCNEEGVLVYLLEADRRGLSRAMISSPCTTNAPVGCFRLVPVVAHSPRPRRRHLRTLFLGPRQAPPP
jgi:hypothetical protein